MNEAESAVAPTAKLSQSERFISAFAAPSRTFNDIRDGNRSWWLPFIVLTLCSYLFFGAVVQHVGIAQAVQNQIHMNAKAQERMADASPEQIAKMQNVSVMLAESAFAASPALSLIYAVVIGAVFLGTINFGFGGRAHFSEMLAVVFHAWLPTLVQLLMGIAVMWFQPPEMFNLKNFAPTNPAALFLDPASANAGLYAFLSQMDLVTIWTLVLLSIGVATVAGVKRSSGYVTVFGWWTIVVLFRTGIAAAFS